MAKTNLKTLCKAGLFCLCFMLYPDVIFADGQKTARSSQENEKVQSATEEWKQIFLFGIEDEVLEAIKSMRAAKETSLHNDLKLLFLETLSLKVKLAVLDYFTAEKVKTLEEPVILILKEQTDDPTISRELILACLRYLMSIESFRELEVYKNLAASEDKGFAATAVKLLGKTGNPAAGSFLLEKLNDIEYEAEIKPEIVLALGELKYQEAVEPLLAIIEDESQEKGLRMYACEALGKIGNPQAIPALKALFSEEDALIKSYAASALSYFDVPEVVDILIQALKDTNWRVRVTAARGLAAVKANKSLEILMYKAEKDPVKDVREEAIRALGELGRRDGFDLLRSLYASEKQPLAIRELCLAVLLDKDFRKTIDVIREVVKKEMARPFPKEDILAMTGAKLCNLQDHALKEIFVMWLSSKSISVKIYAIRGIGTNRYGDLKATVEKLAEEDPVVAVKKAALAVLEKW